MPAECTGFFLSQIIAAITIAPIEKSPGEDAPPVAQLHPPEGEGASFEDPPSPTLASLEDPPSISSGGTTPTHAPLLHTPSVLQSASVLHGSGPLAHASVATH